MAIYRISGIWTDNKGVITHYAVHEMKKNDNGWTITKAIKTSKADAIVLVENNNNSVKSYIWKYSSAGWLTGEDINVVNRGGSKFLRSNHDNTVQDNLLHLIDYSYIY